MINVLLKKSRDLGVLVPGDHPVISEVYQGLGRVRADEAVKPAYDKNHYDISLKRTSLPGPNRFVTFMSHCDNDLSSSTTFDKIPHCLSGLTKRVASIDHRHNFSSFHEFL